MRAVLLALGCIALVLGCGRKADPPTQKGPTANRQPLKRIVPRTVDFCGKRLAIDTTRKVYCRDQGVIQAVTLSGFAKLRLLDVSSSVRLEGVDRLASLPAFRELALYKTEVDISQVARLKHLRQLKLVKAPLVKDLAPLVSLTRLSYLRCSHCAVTDIAFLAKLTGLEALSLSHSPSIKVFKPIGALRQVRFLNLNGTGVSDLSWITGLTKLEKLLLAATKVRNLEPLAGLTGLRELNLASTPVRDLSVLPRLINLDKLNLGANPKLRRLAPLRKMTWLKTLTVTAKVVSARQLARLRKALPRTQVRAR